MGQDPDAIRQDIEQTRAEMSETVEAVGYKADVPSRAKEAVSDKVESVKSRVSDTASRAKEAVVGTASKASDSVSGVASRAGDATPSKGEVKQKTRQVAGLARENPLGLAIGAAAIGFLAGLAVPSTRVEDEKLGPMADQVKDKVKETGQEAMDRGKQVAQEVASTAADTAKQSASEHGQELADSAKQSAQDVKSEASSSSSGSSSAPGL
jgi:gas vesicle protein